MCSSDLDSDDARHDDGDDGGDSPLREGKFPGRFLPAGALLLSLVSASWRRRKNSSSIPPMFLGQRVIVCRRGAGGGATGTGLTRAPRPARGRGSSLPLLLASPPPFGSATYSPKYYALNFSGILGASDVKYLDRYFSS